MDVQAKAASEAVRPANWRRRVRQVLAPPTIVLVYHRVSPDVGRDTDQLVVRPESFAAHLSWIRQIGRPLSLSEFVEQLRPRLRHRIALDGGKPRVLVTFDDGYADNLHHARPLLSLHDVQGTIFATSEAIGSGRPFWWDAVEQIVFEAPAVETWQLPDGTSLPGKSERHEFYRRLVGALARLTGEQRDEALAELGEHAGVEPKATDSCRPMSWAELARWQETGMAVGAHTRSHPRLSALSEGEISVEIAGCRQDLERHLSGPVNTLAYPFGAAEDYDVRAEAAAEAAGFSCAFANQVGNARWARSPYAVPRCLVRDWSPSEFAANFSRWCRP